MSTCIATSSFVVHPSVIKINFTIQLFCWRVIESILIFRGEFQKEINIALVFLSVKSSREFMAQWWMGEDGELELTKNFINSVVSISHCEILQVEYFIKCGVSITLWNSSSWVPYQQCGVNITLWNSSSWVDWDGQDMSYARMMMMIYPGDFFSVSQEESAPEGDPDFVGGGSCKVAYLLTPWSRVLLEKLTSKLCS